MTGQKFRLSPKAVAWEFTLALLAIPFPSTALCLSIVAVRAWESNKPDALKFILPLLLGLSVLILLLVSLVLILLPVGRAVFSHLILSEAGLEYRLWPLHRIRCTWDNVERISTSPLAPLQGEVLTLKKAEVSGFHLLLDFRGGRFGFTSTLPMIPLYRMDGWPNGKLATELRRYSPELFVEPTVTKAG